MTPARLERSPRPRASIVMATHGSWHLTERALRALAEHTTGYEVVVVDNASPDESARMLAETEGVELVASETNLGFGAASNLGAERASGDLLVFLNSDSFVAPGWLDPLVAAVGREQVAAAVPRLLNEDGTLQQAGALLAADATVWQYGAGDDPERLRYRFPRVVDFGAAACLAVCRRDFIDAGGFADAYSPAYYEDADLCMSLAARGRLVVYEPRSAAVHVGQGSTTRAAAVRLSERNRRTFLERWGDELEGRPPSLRDATARRALEARDARAPVRHLVVAGEQPQQACRLAGQLAATWRAARVALLPSAALPAELESGLLEAGVELADGPSPELWLRVRRFYFDTAWLDREQASGAVGGFVRETQPQAVLLSAPASAGDELLDAMAGAGIPPP